MALPASEQEWFEARRLRAEGLSMRAIGERLRRSTSWVSLSLRRDVPPGPVGNRGEVDPAPLRAAAERAVAEGATWSELAIRAGYVHPSTGYGDTSPFKRRLGMMASVSSRSRGGRHTTQRMKYDTALRIARALDLDPVDVGL